MIFDEHDLWPWLRLLTLVNPVSAPLDVDVQAQLLISCDDGLLPTICAVVREQLSGHLSTSLALAFGEFMGTHCAHLCTLPS
ncbi:unnamed protein product [Heligmosomoides polygyrus]|uniref:DUF1902 domain-containing protein n=1 Tax=Heligmosomoides polygyrus TaxID=6339 RepID=A0A183F993_HELPZ|nr:unnamed protein product [Heligmosomoides polygyrus]